MQQDDHPKKSSKSITECLKLKRINFARLESFRPQPERKAAVGTLRELQAEISLQTSTN